jgi:superfamily II DNA or RNA helicase
MDIIGDKIYNPETKRYVNIRGKIGRKLIKGTNLCLAYPSKNKIFKPTIYQKRIVSFVKDVLFSSNDLRGLLLYWSLGSGKTCGAVTAIDEYRKMYPNNKVYVWTMGSLRSNFIQQYCSICGNNVLSDWFIISTMNQSNIKSVIDEIDMNNSLIVIDEAHHLWHGKSNESEQYSLLYDAIDKTTNSKFIFLTGTPLLSNINEIYYLLKLVYMNMTYSLKRFNDYIVTLDRNQIKTWFTPFVFPYFPTEQGEYPVSNENFVLVKIASDEHNLSYEEALKSDQMASLNRPSDLMKSRDPERYKREISIWFLGYSLLKSRQISNLNYPEEINRKYQEDQQIEDHVLDPSVHPNGWITDQTSQNLDTISEKLNQIIIKLNEIEGKHVIYSFFITRYGIKFISSILQILGISHLIFDGSLNDNEREDRLSKFNDDDNKNGDKYKVLLMTNAGSEGINLLSVRALHILEQSIQEWQIDQVKGRVVRLNSHLQLPKDERNVEIYRYIIQNKNTPAGEIDTQSSDFRAYNIGIKNKEKLAPYLAIMGTSDFVNSYFG